MEATQERAAATAAKSEARLVAFFCKWCTYAGADLAGTSRLTYPPNIRVIMLPCTGRIDITLVLRAFLQGADGVLVSGCHPGDCHYTAGNFRARRRWMLFRDLLDVLGFDLQRFECAWISAAEGQKFAKAITSFTDRMNQLGPYAEMREIAESHEAALSEPVAPVFPGDGAGATKPDAELAKAAAEAFASGRIKSLIGWTASPTLGKPRLTWIDASAETAGLVAPAALPGSPNRLLKNGKLRALSPTGVVVRPADLRALNVLCQERQYDPAQLVLFVYGSDGKFQGCKSLQEAQGLLAVDESNGFAPEVLRKLDELMALPREARWKFWREQFAGCIKCYACRQSCSLCNCDSCLAEKNQPQWFPTAADGPGNLAWHIVRAFHLAGRCVGCGACQEACPAGLPINVLGAALARSARTQFSHTAGLAPDQIPLQSDYKPADHEDFIL